MRRLLLSLTSLIFVALGSVAAAQTIPNIPDISRYIQYSVTSGTTNFDVPFALYGDCTDLSVKVAGVPQASGWTCNSKSGTALANIARPVTDAQVVFTSPVSNALVEIQGSWHPRFGMGTAPGITRTEFNRVLGTVLSSQRELFDHAQLFAANRMPVGVGAPSSGVGATGDYYLDISTANVYGPKTASAWPSVALFSLAQPVTLNPPGSAVTVSITDYIFAGETTINNALTRADAAVSGLTGGVVRFPSQATCYAKTATHVTNTENITYLFDPGACVNDSSAGDYFVVGNGTNNPHNVVFLNATINPSGRTFSITGNTHSNTTIDGLSSTAGLVVGQNISGNGIPPATITAIGTGTLTLSSAATTTNTGVSLTVYQPGAAIRFRNTYGAGASNITLGGTQNIGIDVDGGTNQYLTKLDQIHCFGGVSCIRIGNAGGEAQETWISNSTPSGQATAGVELINAGGTYLKNNSYLGNYHSMYIHPSTGQFVTGLGSDNDVMDAGWGSCLLIDTTGGGMASEGIFTSLWAATCSNQIGTPGQPGYHAAATEPGVYLKGSEATLRGFQFPNIRVVNTNAVGIQVDGGRDIDFSGHVAMNSAGSLAGFPGALFNTNVSHFSFKGRSGALMTHITGVGAGNLLSNQTYGVVVNCGTSDYYEIDIDGTGNQTGGIFDCGSGTRKSVRDRGTSDLKSSMATSSSAFSFQAASRAPSSANSGNASREDLTPAGEKSMHGVQDGVGGWWQCALPGTANRLCMINPNGGGVSLGPTAGYPKNVAANLPATFSSTVPLGDVAGAGSAASKNTGTSVADPGTGNLEALLPVQTVAGASKVFAAADLYQETRRSNSGSAMSDTFPPTGTVGLTNGSRMFVNNVDASANLTINAGSGTTVNGLASIVVGPGRSSLWVYDSSATNWRPTGNSLTALLAANNLSELANKQTARGSAGLNVESGTGHGDSIYTILATDRWVFTNAAFTASRTWTLPAANAVNAGAMLVVDDAQGTVTATNTLIVSRAGSDTINGGTSFTIDVARGRLILFSDGVSKWTARLQRPYGTAAGNAVYLDVTTGNLPAINLGTPTGGVLTNATGLPYAGISAVAPTTYTPTITTNGGSPTFTSQTGDYIQIGKQVCFRAGWNQSAAGTGFMTVTLPVAPNLTSSLVVSGTGQETATAGTALYWTNRGSDTTARVTDFAGSYPTGGVGAHFSINGCYFAS